MKVLPRVFDNVKNIIVDGDPMLKRAPDLASMLDYWNLTDALIDGAKAVRHEGEKYLPKFPSEDEKTYKFRKQLTKFTNVYRDIVESLSSKPFEKQISLIEPGEGSIPEHILEFVKDVDGAGNNLTAFGSQSFFNGINSAIDWIFVDYPKDNNPDRVKTVADVKAQGIRPWWSHVLGRNVLEARSEVIDGTETLTYIRILEPGKPDYIRIFERDENGVVKFELYKKLAKPVANQKTSFEKIDGGDLTIEVIPLVPFMVGRRDGRTFKIYPAMRDAADLQIELYQEESGLKYAKNLTAFPMLAGNGVNPPKEADGKTPKKLATGPNVVLYTGQNPAGGSSGEWKFIEPSSESLKFLAADAETTKQQLRELGRQPLTAQSDNLTVVTTQVAANKARSAVASWALTLKDALEHALRITCMWLGEDDDFEPIVEVYKDFDTFIEGVDNEALIKMRENREISQLTFWHEMKRRNVLSDEFDPAIEKDRLLGEVPGDTEIDDGVEPPLQPE